MEDEVYRQMFRLEAHRAGAEIDLALSLLRAWQVTSSRKGSKEEQAWLKKICPICLSMIEDALESLRSAHPSGQ